MLWLKGYYRERSETDTGVSWHHVHHRKPFRRGASQRKMPSSHRAVRGVIIPKRQPNLFHRLSCGFPVSIDTIQPVEPGSHCLPNCRLARGTTPREDPEPPPQIATALAIVSFDIRTAYDPRPRRRGVGGAEKWVRFVMRRHAARIPGASRCPHGPLGAFKGFNVFIRPLGRRASAEAGPGGA